MTQVDFYILRSAQLHERLLFCTKLSEKALHSRMAVVVCLPSPALVRQLSELLWLARPESFLPNSSEADAHCPIWLTDDGCGLPSPAKPSLLINLTADFDPRQANFARIAEVVIQDETVLKETRNLYTRYKACGLNPSTHKI